MKKRTDLKLLSILCVVVILFLALSTLAFSAQEEKASEWIGVEGGSITCGNVTIKFESGVLTKNTKIHIIYFGDGEYQFGPEIHIDGTFTVSFDVPPDEVFTFLKGEWVEVENYDSNVGYFETYHFSRYRGC